MGQLDLVYIIPPYLLSTCLGSSLQREVASKDSRMGLLNVIPTDSPFHYKKQDMKPPTNRFSNDPILNDIIKEKVLYKLSIIGALGSNPMEIAANDDEYVFKMCGIFKHRLIENSQGPLLGDTSKDSKNGLEQAYPSIYNSDRIGEVSFSNLPSSKLVPNAYKQYLDYTLKDLLLHSNYDDEIYNSYGIPQSYIRFSDNSFFHYPLPISWVPLIQNKRLSYLKKYLDFKIENDTGFSEIKLSTRIEKESSDIDEQLNKNQYLNFICDKLVTPSSGIYYYEIEVSQETVDRLNINPILQMNDLSTSSTTTPSIATGFARRHVCVPSPHSSVSSPNYNLSGSKVDLESIKKEILFNQDDQAEGILNNDIENSLSLKPGEMPGSFAINLEDLNFYNSVKASEAMQRDSILNMNRRLSSLNRTNMDESASGKIDIGVSFRTYTTLNETRKIQKTDIIGCGINYVDKSLFFTINGVLIKIINQEELSSNNSIADNLFSEDGKISVYPIIGLKLNELKDIKSEDPASLVITTNFGFKEFQFNICNYVRNFRVENQNFLLLLEQSNKSSSESQLERSLKNIDSDSNLLNKMIEGYLNHEGYVETFKAFNSDLKKLSKNIGNEEYQDNELSLLKKYQALNRQVIKNYITKNQFDLALKFLSLNFQSLLSDEEGRDLVFEIQILKYLFLLKEYVESRLNSHLQNTDELFVSATDYGHELQKEYSTCEAKIDRINQLSSLILVNDIETLHSLPKECHLLKGYSHSVNGLASKINKKILKSLGFSEISNLETIFNNVNQNINLLSLKYHDDKFVLTNFERDHMDL
ncbi:uncharacterized protein PRCAT00000323001 [Priceomyces carsonii]|uniref:uncharacterized protein n=1 Tax=Priceomyces carsonii TaxID=28549 RepID=UPI002ED93C56|nr:unnamed protein product [Priceomyces carsonii]